MSIKKIAEMTGLSITTVSHAINGTRKVSAKSKEMIDKAVAEINYRPNLAAQMMKTQKSSLSWELSDNYMLWFAVLHRLLELPVTFLSQKKKTD